VAHLRSVVLNARDRESLVGFWRAILNVGVLSEDVDLGITWLQPDSEFGIRLGIQAVEARNSHRPQVHLDVAVDDLEQSTTGALAMGASLVATHHTAKGLPWRVLADPEGNEFCLYCE
jgi:predicted enzyme related to lactoylglutathione lyase